MNILKINTTQRKIDFLKIFKIHDEYKSIYPVTLFENDGFIYINDGHHRLTYYYMQGKKELNPTEYSLIQTELYKQSFGNVQELIARSAK